jgi:hypothetical protein
LFSKFDSLSSIFLQKRKTNLNESGKVLFFKKDFLFVSTEVDTDEDRLHKQSFFKKYQPVNEVKKNPLLGKSTTYITRT